MTDKEMDRIITAINRQTERQTQLTGLLTTSLARQEITASHIASIYDRLNSIDRKCDAALEKAAAVPDWTTNTPCLDACPPDISAELDAPHVIVGEPVAKVRVDPPWQHALTGLERTGKVMSLTLLLLLAIVAWSLVDILVG